MSDRRKIGRPKTTGTTPQHTVRMSDEKWHKFGEATDKAGTDRGSAVNGFVDWYVGDTDDLPERPDA